MHVVHHKKDNNFFYYTISSPSPYPKDAIICFHGFGQSKNTLLPAGKLLYDKIQKKRSQTTALEVIIPDLNHHEENHQKLVLNSLFKNFNSKILNLKQNYKSISLIGISLGSLLNAYLASNSPKTIRSAVFISLPYNIRKALPKKLRMVFLKAFSGTNNWLFPWKLFFEEYKQLQKELKHLRFRYTLRGPEISIGALNYLTLPDLLLFLQDDFRTLPLIQGVHCPSLFIYGGQDEYLGASRNQLDPELHTLYEQCPAKNKYLYLIKEASHGLSDLSEPNLDFLKSDIYFEPVIDEIASFFHKHLA